MLVSEWYNQPPYSPWNDSPAAFGPPAAVEPRTFPHMDAPDLNAKGKDTGSVSWASFSYGEYQAPAQRSHPRWMSMRSSLTAKLSDVSEGALEMMLSTTIELLETFSLDTSAVLKFESGENRWLFSLELALCILQSMFIAMAKRADEGYWHPDSMYVEWPARGGHPAEPMAGQGTQLVDWLSSGGLTAALEGSMFCLQLCSPSVEELARHSSKFQSMEQTNGIVHSQLYNQW